MADHGQKCVHGIRENEIAASILTMTVLWRVQSTNGALRGGRRRDIERGTRNISFK